jgi:PAS domain S-box-containing protein
MGADEHSDTYQAISCDHGGKGLSENQAPLACDAAALRRLNEASSRLWHAKSLGEGLDEMLSAAIELLGADKGDIQLLDTSRGLLKIAAQRGFSPAFLDEYRELPAEAATSCGRALRSGGCSVIEDTEADEAYAPYRQAAAQEGYRAVQSTPLVGRNGTVLGMISAHFRDVHRPSSDDLQRLDLYARQAAGFIERCQTEEALREQEGRLAAALRAGKLGVHEYDPQTGRMKWDRETCRLWGVPEGEAVTVETFEAGVHPEDVAAVKAAIAGAFDPAGTRHCECEFRVVSRADGSVRWVFADGDVTFADGGAVRLVGTMQDVTERKRAEARIHQLMREVNHRSKNMLSIVQAIARQTAANSPGDFLERFGGRIQALAASQDLLIMNAWKGAALPDLVRSQLTLFQDLIGSRIELSGPPLLMPASAAQLLGMALHELATNAAKYGALSSRFGRVAIDWRLEAADGAEPSFFMSWCESGGPPVREPLRRGFGSVILTDMPEASLGAKVYIDFARAGFTWRLRCPAREVLEEVQCLTAPASALDAGGAPRTGAAPRILIVEDEPLAAHEIAEILNQGGFCAVGPAGNVAQALELLRTDRCDAAVLVVNLGKDTSEAIALELMQLHMPFVTVPDAYRAQSPAALADAPALSKSAGPDTLIGQVWRCVAARSPAGAKPEFA